MPTSTLTLWDCFARTAAHPDRPALVAGTTALTYAQLRAHAESLAARLTADAPPPRRIALLAARTPVTYAAYLAVQRLGGAVVPLNPAAPPGRNETVVRQADAALVLADATGDTAPAGRAAPLLPVALTDPADAPELRGLPGPGPQDTAYILFTSGSTGRPKGVVIRHTNTDAYLDHAVEPLTVRQARAFAAAAPAACLENLYGPTELTVTCTGYRLPADPAHWPHTANGTVPIGTAHPGAETLVVDERMRPADQGELLVRGPQRFPGYLDPADNPGRFATGEPDTGLTPYEGGPLTGTHWYRTGDRVTRDGDAFVHLGRLDNQVKISGYRVELGEVEEALRSCPGVADAVVVARTDRSTPVLEAVCTGDAPDPAPLLAALQERLPAYMVPHTLLRLPELPPNLNGKTDRKAVQATLNTARPAVSGPPPTPKGPPATGTHRTRLPEGTR